MWCCSIARVCTEHVAAVIFRNCEVTAELHAFDDRNAALPPNSLPRFALSIAALRSPAGLLLTECSSKCHVRYLITNALFKALSTSGYSDSVLLVYSMFCRAGPCSCEACRYFPCGARMSRKPRQYNVSLRWHSAPKHLHCAKTLALDMNSRLPQIVATIWVGAFCRFIPLAVSPFHANGIINARAGAVYAWGVNVPRKPFAAGR